VYDHPSSPRLSHTAELHSFFFVITSFLPSFSPISLIRLYLPPYWFHHVSALEEEVSISLSIHSESEEAALRDKMISFPFPISPPILSALSLRQKADALFLFLSSISHHLLLSEKGNESNSENIRKYLGALVGNLVLNRYGQLESDSTVTGLSEIILKETESWKIKFLNTTVIFSENQLRAISDSGKEFSTILLSFKSNHIMQIEFMNYIEVFIP